MRNTYGTLTGTAVGIILKEAVRRAILAIRAERFRFEAMQKDGLDGRADLVTTADKAAQRVYLKVIRESFPGYGVVAEEDNLSIPCSLQDRDSYITIDPLDGTRAFTRRQSDGIGTMISIVENGDVIAAYVGDVMTGEIYGYRPGSNKVHRLSDFGFAEQLEIDPKRPLRDQYVALREEPLLYSEATQYLINRVRDGGFRDAVSKSGMFSGVQILGGSIGIHLARLWKGEIGATILQPNIQTPWDLTPVVGICRKLGFTFLKVDDSLTEYIPTLKTKPYPTDFDTLILHESQLAEVRRQKRVRAMRPR